jgi:hypothetical protein
MPSKSKSAPPSRYQVGDIVFWATASAAGECTVIGHPKGQPHVLVFAGGGEVDAELDRYGRHLAHCSVGGDDARSGSR